jgi:hypothetical protein
MTHRAWNGRGPQSRGPPTPLAARKYRPPLVKRVGAGPRRHLRISRTVFSALSGTRLLACLIVAPQRGYDEPGILSYAISSFCPTSADGLHVIDVHRREAAFQRSSFAMRCTVPVPMPRDLASFKIPTPFASCFRTFRSVALSTVGRPSFFYSLANHRPLKFGKGS